jgi:polysaccharide biosynthesis protein PslG
MARQLRPVTAVTLIAALLGGFGVMYLATVIAPERVQRFGMSVPDLIAVPAAVQASQLAGMKAIGITSVRLDANWGWVQYGGPKTFDWAQLDQVVASARAAGMSVDLIIDGCPPWAALAGTTGAASPQPASPAQYAAWAAAVAARYAPQGVGMFEIWNEPNNQIFWQPKPSPAAYTADLVAAYASIKSVDPSAFVISAGLAPEVSDGTNISAIDFLKAMYAHGAKGHFDALGYHPYSYPALPNTYQSWSGWSQMNQTSPSIRSVMASHGDSAKQIWITEFGAPSGGPDGVGQAAQATALTQAITNARQTSWIGGLYLYSWQDEGTDQTNNEGTNQRNDEAWFELLTAGGAPKAAYRAVAAAIG